MSNILFGHSELGANMWVSRGVVTNIIFENFYLEGAAIGPQVVQTSGNNGKLQ